MAFAGAASTESWRRGKGSNRDAASRARPRRPAGCRDESEAVCYGCRRAGGERSLGSGRRRLDWVRRAGRISELRSELQKLRAIAGVPNLRRSQQRRIRTLSQRSRRLRSADLETAACGIQHWCDRGHGENGARLHVQARSVEPVADNRGWGSPCRRVERRDNAGYPRRPVFRGTYSSAVSAVPDRVPEHQGPAASLNTQLWIVYIHVSITYERSLGPSP